MPINPATPVINIFIKFFKCLKNLYIIINNTNNLFCLLSSLIFISSKKWSLKFTLLENPPLLKLPNNSSFLDPTL